MKQSLEKINELISTFQYLNPNECDFIASYFRDLSYKLAHFHHGYMDIEINLYELLSECGSDDYTDFIIFLLEKCYDEDDYMFVSSICGYCYGNLPQDNRIRDILVKGFNDSNKSNRLRERFFWNFNYAFRNDSINFFQSELSDFINYNLENPTIVCEVVDFMHWNIKEDNQHLEEIRTVVNQYFQIRPEAINEICSATKQLLGIT